MELDAELVLTIAVVKMSVSHAASVYFFFFTNILIAVVLPIDYHTLTRVNDNVCVCVVCFSCSVCV